MFQHDNDPKHTSKKAKNYLANQNYSVLEWPSIPRSQSNRESLGTSEKAIYYRVDRDDVFLVQEEWAKIPVANMQKLVHSMPNRCKAVIKAQGCSTKY